MAALESHLAFFEGLSARRADRLLGAAYLADHPEHWEGLFLFSLNPKAKRIHVVLCWCVELYIIPQPDLLQASFNHFLEQLPKIKNESMRRSLSKMLFYYAKKNSAKLTPQHKGQIIALAFDWLIEPAQVATQNFALKLLRLLQDEAAWVKEELKAIVQQQMPTASPGYRAAAREIFK